MNGFPHNLISYTKAATLGFKELKHLSLSRLRKVFSLMGKQEKIILFSLLIIIILSLLWSGRNIYVSRTSLVANFGGSYTEGLIGQPTYLNPLLAHQETELALTKLIFSGLYKYDSNGQLIPDLADGMPQISTDQKQYTVNLKREAKWHNEKQVTADDIIFTFQLLKDPAYKSPLRPLWQATTVEKLSDYSVKFTTKDIAGPFAENLTLPILPKNIWSKVDAQNFLLSKFNLEAIGSGPYSIKEIKKQSSGKIQQISMQSNRQFYGERPKIDTLTIKFYDSEEDLLNAFHSREISGFGFIPLGSNLYLDKDQAGAQILQIPLPQYQVVFFNLNNKILADQNVRKALSLATNKKQIIEEVFKNNALIPSSPLLFPEQKNTQPPTTGANVEQAKILLDEAGWTVNVSTGIRTSKKGTPLEISLSTSDTMANAKAAEILANQWRTLNIKVSLVILPSKQLTDTLIKPRAFDVLLFPQKFGADPDPFLFWHSTQAKDPGVNLTGFQDATADKLITEARTTTDRKIRQNIYQKFNLLIEDKVPVIFLDQAEYIYVLDEKIKNVDINFLPEPAMRFHNIQNWYINTTRHWK